MTDEESKFEDQELEDEDDGEIYDVEQDKSSDESDPDALLQEEEGWYPPYHSNYGNPYGNPYHNPYGPNPYNGGGGYRKPNPYDYRSKCCKCRGGAVFFSGNGRCGKKCQGYGVKMEFVPGQRCQKGSYNFMGKRFCFDKCNRKFG